MRKFIYILSLLLGVSTFTCQREAPVGQLFINAKQSGNFDIYKLTEKSELGDRADLELVAETRGIFNEHISLSPGSYLVSADCSSKNIIIYPGQVLRLNVTNVEFKPVRSPQASDRFSIECVQQSSIQMTQVIKNRFSLFMFAGKHSLLVNQVSQQIEIEEDDEAQHREISLSALNVERHDQQGNQKSSMYFVSSFKEQIGLTTVQEQGHWQHLLPGHYQIELNGTKVVTEITGGQEVILKPALLKFSVPEGVDLAKAETVLRSPLHVDLNDGHFLSYNETYPILSGKFQFRPNQYLRNREDQVQAGEVKEIQLKSIEVLSNCSPWDYTCIGAQDIHLYKEGEIYPLIKTVSGVPILFLDESLLFAVQGAGRIKVPLTEKKTYRIGRIHIKPTAVAEDKFTSDMIRIESQDHKSTVFTNDLPFDRESTLTLPEGRYFLANYVTVTHESGMRKRIAQAIEVNFQQENTFHVPVYLSSERAQNLQKQIQQNSPPSNSRSEKSRSEIPVF